MKRETSRDKNELSQTHLSRRCVVIVALCPGSHAIYDVERGNPSLHAVSLAKVRL